MQSDLVYLRPDTHVAMGLCTIATNIFFIGHGAPGPLLAVLLLHLMVLPLDVGRLLQLTCSRSLERDLLPAVQRSRASSMGRVQEIARTSLSPPLTKLKSLARSPICAFAAVKKNSRFWHKREARPASACRGFADVQVASLRIGAVTSATRVAFVANGLAVTAPRNYCNRGPR